MIVKTIKYMKGEVMSTIKKIHTVKAPAAVGPYSQAIIANGVVYTSGQIPLDPATGEIVEGDIKEQADRVMKNITAVVEEAGTNMKNVIKTMCFLSDMNDFADFNEVYSRYFTEKPARSCVAVKSLPKNALCEIEVIAIL